MTQRHQNFELTGIGKEHRPKLEPRILLKDPERSDHVAHRVSDQDISDNQPIFGSKPLSPKGADRM
ncbi:MAG: hypothetical protein IAE85_06315 [Anaerolinea sp.]|nr:hypothetical protein [Anaerolinea sp.]